eukprot:2499099-Amphidinium_carterae.1
MGRRCLRGRRATLSSSATVERVAPLWLSQSCAFRKSCASWHHASRHARPFVPPLPQVLHP